MKEQNEHKPATDTAASSGPSSAETVAPATAEAAFAAVPADGTATRPEHRRRMPKWLKRLLIVLGSVVGFFMLVIAALWFILTPARLTPIVIRVCDSFLNADVKFESVGISFIKEFPYATVQLKGAEITSKVFAGDPVEFTRQLPPDVEKLASVETLEVSVNLWSLLTTGKIQISRLRLDGSNLNAFVAPDGRANWEIYSVDTTAITETAEEESDFDIEINIRRLSVSNGCLIAYEDYRDYSGGWISLKDLSAEGAISTNFAKLDITRAAIDSCNFNIYLDGEQTGADLNTFELTRRDFRDYAMKTVVTDLKVFDVALADSLAGEGQVLVLSDDHTQLRAVDLRITAASHALNKFGKPDEITALANSYVGITLDSTAFDGTIAIEHIYLGDILRLIPADYLPEDFVDYPRHIETDILADAAIGIKGAFGYSTDDDERLPSLRIGLQLPDGYLSYNESPKNSVRLDTLGLDATIGFDVDRPDSCYVDLRHLKVVGLGMSLDAHGEIGRYLEDPQFDLTVKGVLSLYELGKTLSTYGMDAALRGISLRGRLDLDADIHSRLSQLGSVQGLTRGRTTARLSMDSVRVDIPAQGIHLLVGRGAFGIGGGATRGDAILTRGTRVLGGGFSLDTLSLRLDTTMRINARNLKLEARAAASNFSRDTTAVHPSRGTLSATSLRVELGDSATVIMRNMEGDWSVSPTPGEPRTPRLALDLGTTWMAWREPSSRYTLSRTRLQLGATFYKQNREQELRRTARLDSLQHIYPDVPRDSLYAHAARNRGGRRGGFGGVIADDSLFRQSNIDLTVSDDLGGLLRRWELYGSLTSERGRVVTPYFPVDTHLSHIDMAFNTDEVTVNSLGVKAGQSQVNFSGQISGLRRAMLNAGRIRGTIHVDADTLNFTELVRVTNAGMELMAMGGVGHVEDDAQLQQRIEMSVDTSAASSLIIIPRNVDLTLNLNVRHGNYGALVLRSVTGQAVARSRVLQLNDFEMQTDAGRMVLSGMYATRSPKDIEAGFDLDMQDIQVEKLIGLMPEVDSLLPMLRSLEGVVSCQVAATVEIDEQMNMLLPTLRGACHIEGHNLVLLDGETFAEISKKLMFKNKERNLVDHIEAEILIHDSKIEIFPFILEIDRYRTAISGEHGLDMNFRYHISVLKSPLPFRLGIDIVGNLDDFKFKIRSARYKSANLPSRTEIINQTRMNLREYIDDVFIRGAESGGSRNRFDIPVVAADTAAMAE